MHLTETADGIRFQVTVQPKSSRNLIVGRHGEALKVKLKAPPVEGAANRMLVQFVAKALKVPKSAVEIVAGQTSRVKQLLVHYPAAPPSPADRCQLRQAILALAEKQESP
jgi:uncharacterized protein (TIGR00251 family)